MALPFRRQVLFWVPVLFFTHLSYAASSNSSSEVSLKLLRTLFKPANTENEVFSPYAIRHALGLAATGARGKTQKQLGRGPEGFTSKKSSTYKLLVASRLWVQRGFPVLESFMNQCEVSYGDRPWMVDFAKAPDFVKDRVNGWVEEKTSGKVRNFIPEIDPASRMLLSSAVYFKGDWMRPFSSAHARTETFSLKSGEAVKAKFMRVHGRFSYFKGDNVQIVEIPYVDGDVSLVVILPSKSENLEDIEESLKPERLDAWMKSLSPREVSISLPKFEFESSYDLTESLKALGIEDAFTPDSADFSVMTGKKDLYLGHVHHKVFISVTELGTEAGGASGIGEGRSPASSAVIFEANRPFLFGIRHVGSNSFILMGKLVKPILPEVLGE